MVSAVGELGDLGAADLEMYEVIEGRPAHAHLGGFEVRARGDDLDDLLGTIDAFRFPLDPDELPTALVTALRAEPRRADTTSLAVADGDGNACSVTTSLGLSSGVWLPDFGMHLNSMLGEGELLRGNELPGRRMG